MKKRVRHLFKKIRRKTLRCVEWLVVSFARSIVPRLSRRAELRLARLIGRIMSGPAGRKNERVAMANMDIVYGDSKTAAEKKELYRRQNEHAAIVLLDYFWFSRDTAERVSKYCSPGDARIEEWIAGDWPGFFLTAHIGNWELGGQYAAWSGRTISSVFRPLGTRLTMRSLLRFRNATGQRAIPREGAVIGIMRALRGGRMVAMLLDQHTDTRDGGIYLDFFGLPAAFSNTIGLISHKLGMPICPVSVIYDKGTDRYSIKSYGLITSEDAKALAPEEITAKVVRFTEEMILDNPEQWLWVYRRWKRFRLSDDPSRFPWYAILDI